MRRGLDSARDGRTTTLLVGGEAGVGKTRLIEEFLTGATSAGGFALVGGCPPTDSTDLPFAPFVAALRSLTRLVPPGELDVLLEGVRPELAQVLPALADGKLVDAPATGGRTRLFEAMLTLFERLGEARGPVVLVLEDLHWADQSSRDLFAFLVRNLRDAPVLQVATYRSDAVPIGDPLRILLAELDRSDRVDRWELSRFGRDEVGAQMAAILAAEPDPERLEEVFKRSDGNAFFIEELVAGLETDSRMPETLRETMLSRMSPLAPEVQQVVRIAAVAGRRSDHQLIARITQFNEHLLAAALREAVSQNVLLPIKDDDGEGFTFRHTLLWQAVYDDLLATERTHHHATIAAALAADPELVSGPASSRDAVIASHWLAGDVPARAIPALIRAGYAAEASYAFAEAANAYEAALRLWDGASVPPRPSTRLGFRAPDVAEPQPWPDRLEVIRRAAETASLAGSSSRAIERQQELVSGTGWSADPAVAGLDLVRLGRYHDEAGDTEAALDAYARAAALVAGQSSSPDLVRILTARARALNAAGRYDTATTIARQALETALESGEEPDVLAAREALGVALAFGGNVKAGLEQLVEARRMTVERHPATIRPRPSRVGEVVRGFADLASILERAGQPEEAVEASREGVDFARHLGVEATWGSTLELQTARGRIQLGDWVDADRITLQLLRKAPRGVSAARVHVLRARLEIGRGAFDAAALHLDAARLQAPSHPDATFVGDLAGAGAELAIWRSQLTDARDAVDRGLSRLHDGEDQVPAVQLIWLGIRAEADRAEMARARTSAVERSRAIEVGRTLRAEAIGLQDRLAGRESIAPRELRALPAFIEGEWSRLGGTSDPEAWLAAVARAEELRDPYLEAYGRWRESEAILAGRGGRARAEATLREGHALASKLGAEPIRREIEELARRARLELVVAPTDPLLPHGPSASETLGLTPRELEVLALVAAGYTNRRIADALFITEKTAGHHVSNLLSKLGAATRVEAASMAHRLGLLDSVDAHGLAAAPATGGSSTEGGQG